MNTDWIEDRWI